MNFKRHTLPALLVTLLSPIVLAQAPVTDIGTPQRKTPANSGIETGGASTYPAQGYPAESGSIESPRSFGDQQGSIERPVERPASSSGSSFQQLQQLQEEVAAIRGQVEEQNYAIQRLQQDVQRLSAGNNTSTGSSATTTSSPAPVAAAPADNNMTTDGKDEYETAYGKLKSKDYDGAVSGFKALIDKYPNSEYSGSAYFWLGFIFQTKGDTDGATKSFSSMIERFPNHSKTPDAKYNLGKLYHQQGNTAKAKELLQDVASGNSKSAPLAKSYLETL